jgi:predicted transcriptional regulator
MTIATTLKLSAKLRAEVKRLARKEGKSPHAWMVDAVAAQAERSAKRAAFVADALKAAEEVDRGGETYAAEEVHEYLRSRAAGKRRPRPLPVNR